MALLIFLGSFGGVLARTAGYLTRYTRNVETILPNHSQLEKMEAAAQPA